MSNEEKSTHSREFRARVVLEASSGEKDPLQVAETHGVSPQQILDWATEMNISVEGLVRLRKAAGEEASHGGGGMPVSISTDSERFADSIRYGATHDILDMRKLTFWSLFGSGFVLLIIVALMAAYSLTTTETIRQVYEQSGDHYRIHQLHERDRQRLSGFGVVDAEEGVYHVPIERVFDRMVREAGEN